MDRSAIDVAAGHAGVMAGVVESVGPLDRGRSGQRTERKTDPRADAERALQRLRLSGADAETMTEAQLRIAANHARGISWAGQAMGPRAWGSGPCCDCGSELVDVGWQGDAILRCDQCGSRWHLRSRGGSSMLVGLSGPSKNWLDTNRPLAAPVRSPGPVNSDEEVRVADYLRPDARLLTVLAPVLDDLAETCPVRMTVEAWGDRRDPDPTAMVWGPDGGGTGLSADLDAPTAEQVVELAGKVQEAAVEELWRAGLSATWPSCPHHPDSHLLEPVIFDDRAVWRCPRSRQIVGDIGGLAGTDRPASHP